MPHFHGDESCYRALSTEPGLLGAIIGEGITMSKQAEFAVILKMNPMFADLGSEELQRLAGLYVARATKSPAAAGCLRRSH